MSGYSDRIAHAFAFAAKHIGAYAPDTGTAAFLAHPASVAVILTRYGCDQVTVVAGILHHVLEAAPYRARLELEPRIHDKFGHAVLSVARAALEPRFDMHGQERQWQEAHDEYLMLLASTDPRAVDICVADELHRCGTSLATVRRLGCEYVADSTHATAAQAVWWYRSLLEVLTRRPDWSRPAMLEELRGLSVELARHLMEGGDQQEGDR